MKFVAISDTHGERPELPPGDVLIHAGDVSTDGSPRAVGDFLSWFGGLDFPHKVFIAGNHDFFFERTTPTIPEGVTYLQDSGTEIGGLKIWGSPISPWFCDWAFNRNRGADIRKHWDLIPEDTDILITHGPPAGILDKTREGEHAGCVDLLNRIEKIQPKMHVFGHIHEGYGRQGNFINASVLDRDYALKDAEICFKI